MQNQMLLTVCCLAGLILLDGALLRGNATRQKSISARRESEARYRQFFEFSAAAIGIASPEGNYLQVNLTTCRLLGYREDEMLALNILDITHPDDRPMVRQQLAELLSGKRQVIDYENATCTRMAVSYGATPPPPPCATNRVS